MPPAGIRAGGNASMTAKRRFAPLWDAIGRQLRRPSGAGGALAGALMAIANAKPYRLAIDALDVKPDDSVLELGFGPGYGIAALAGRTPQGRVCGIDHSPPMLARCVRGNRAAIAAGRVDLRLGTFSALPWPDGAFDKLLLVNVVYFFDPGGRDMAEACRVLRPGGRLAIFATDRATMQAWPFARSASHLTFDAGTLATLLEGAGFASGRIVMEAAQLPLGIGGLIAAAEKDV